VLLARSKGDSAAPCLNRFSREDIVWDRDATPSNLLKDIQHLHDESRLCDALPARCYYWLSPHGQNL